MKKTLESKPIKTKMGRPSKYNPEIHPKIVNALAARGYIESEIQDIIGISVATFTKWKKDYPDFLNSILEGKKDDIQAVERSLIKKAKGYDYEEVTKVPVTGDDGNVIMEIVKTVSKHVPASDSAIQFYLTNIVRDKYQNTQKIDVNANVNNVADMTPEQRHIWLVENGYVKDKDA